MLTLLTVRHTDMNNEVKSFQNVDTVRHSELA